MNYQFKNGFNLFKPDNDEDFDKVQHIKTIIKDENGKDILQVKKFVVCSICGTLNEMPTTICRKCSNVLNIKEEEM